MVFAVDSQKGQIEKVEDMTRHRISSQRKKVKSSRASQVEDMKRALKDTDNELLLKHNELLLQNQLLTTLATEIEQLKTGFENTKRMELKKMERKQLSLNRDSKVARLRSEAFGVEVHPQNI